MYKDLPLLKEQIKNCLPIGTQFDITHVSTVGGLFLTAQHQGDTYQYMLEQIMSVDNTLLYCISSIGIFSAENLFSFFRTEHIENKIKQSFNEFHHDISFLSAFLFGKMPQPRISHFCCNDLNSSTLLDDKGGSYDVYQMCGVERFSNLELQSVSLRCDIYFNPNSRSIQYRNLYQVTRYNSVEKWTHSKYRDNFKLLKSSLLSEYALKSLDKRIKELTLSDGLILPLINY